MNTINLNYAELHPAADARRFIAWGAGLIVLAFGLGGAWAGLAPLSGAVIAGGSVKVEANRKTVQHLEGGIVKRILVKDGTYVKAGQPLIVIGDERTTAENTIVNGDLYAELAKAARLQAERDGAATPAFPAQLIEHQTDRRVIDAMRVENNLFQSKRRSLQEQLHLIQEQIDQAKLEIGGLQSQAESNVAAAGLMQQELEANQNLQKLNFVSKMQVLRLQRGQEEYTMRRGENLASLAKAKQKITDLNMRSATLRNEYLQTASSELASAQSRIADLQARVKSSDDAVMRQQILAPIAGTIVDLKVFTEGGIVAPREALLDIVPDETALLVEARVNLDDIRHLQLGMAADIRFSAYHARGTPVVRGELIYISADRLLDRDTGAAYYQTRVKVPQEALKAAGDLNLQPGMRAEVFLKTGDRTALDYLLEPVLSSLRRASREP